MAAHSGKVVLSGMVEKVAFVNKWPMLIKATSDDDTPTPGYLYKEISDLSFVSSGYCTSLLSFLVDRLDKSSFHIKVKVLRILKHVVENGHPDFKVGLRRQAAGIQNASKFSGNPDSLHGNAPYVAVRKAAMALSEVLFDTEHPKSPKRTTEGKVQSTAYVDPSKIQGFGNSPTHQPHATKSLTEVIKGGVEHLASNLTNLNTDSRDMTHARQYRPITGFQNTGQRSKMSSSYHSSSTSRRADDQYKAVDVDRDAATKEMQSDGRMASRGAGAVKSSQKPGGCWSADLQTFSHESNDSSGQKSAASTDMSEKLASVAVEDWSQEIMLVEDFVSSSNAKATPSRDELNQFSKRCATSSSEKVLELLDKKLVSNSISSVQMRALCAIEIIIREDLVAVEMAKDVLHTNLHLLIGSQDKLVQAKAKKISKQLDRLLDESCQVLQKSTTSLQQETTPALRTLVQFSPQQGAPTTVIGENVNVNVLATSSCAPVSEKRTDSKSLFSGMSLGQAKVESSSIGRGDALGKHEDDPFGLRSATCKIDSQVEGKPKDNTKYDTALSLESRTDATLSGNTKTEIKDTSLLTSLDPSSVTKETVAQETVLDTLLDLSSTEQATLIPLSSGANPVGFNERPAGGDKMAADASSVQMQSSCSGSQVEVESIPRTSYVDDLLATIDPLAQSKTLVKDDQSAASVQPISFTPVTMETKSVEELSQLYPQLSATQLSGTSAVPLSLGRKPQTKSFAFVETEEDKKEKRTNKGQEDAFGFVHDAMTKASKR